MEEPIDLTEQEEDDAKVMDEIKNETASGGGGDNVNVFEDPDPNDVKREDDVNINIESKKRIQSGPHKFANFVSFVLVFLIVLMSILYLSLICQKPCAANMLYLFNIALMFSIFVFQCFYVGYVMYNQFETNIVFWLSIIGIFAILILAIVSTIIYNAKVPNNREKLMALKKRMRNVNIAIIVIVTPLLFVYIYQIFYGPFDVSNNDNLGPYENVPDEEED